MTITQPQPAALPEGLRYYLLRGNMMVPLVPADQLPFQLQGLPRQLTHRQMSDESWKLLQETDYVAKNLTVQAPGSIMACQHMSPPKPRFLAPDHHVRTDSPKALQGTPTINRLSLPLQSAEKATDKPHNSPIALPERPLSLTDTFASIYPSDAQRLGYRVQYPSGIEPDQSKKEYCTHWIKTGECAFISIGCKYKHEMPTMDKLRDLGFTQLPKWWKEKSAINSRGPTWMQRRLALDSHDDKDIDEMPPPREFPDPLVLRLKRADERRGEDEVLSCPERCAKLDQGPALRSTLRPTPMSVARRDSQVSNLLIDLEAPTTSPPSPQLSDLSINSASSSDTGVPSSLEPTSLHGKPPATMTRATRPKVSEVQPRDESSSRRLIVRRESLMSWASSGEDDIPPVRSSSKQKTSPHKPARRPNTQPKQAGLAKSKHAVTNEVPKPSEARSQVVECDMLQPKGDGVAVRQKLDRMRCSSTTRPAKRPRKAVAGVVKQTRT
jgi:hypothetical protein